MRRVYVSGPITGYPNLNEHAFREAAGLLCARGDDPLIPHDMQPHSHAGKCPEVYGDRTVGDHDGGCYQRADLVAMLEQADVVYAKATNGEYQLSGYDAHNAVAFALIT